MQGSRQLECRVCRKEEAEELERVPEDEEVAVGPLEAVGFGGRS